MYSEEHGVFLRQVINLGCLCSLTNTGETIVVCGNLVHEVWIIE